MVAHVRNGAKGWFVEVYWKGKHKLKRFGQRQNSEKLALKFAEKVNSIIHNGDPWMLNGVLSETKPQVPTIKEYSKQWLAVVEGTIKPATLLSYKQNIDIHIVPEMGSELLTNIDYKLLKTFILKKASTYKRNTIRIMMATTSAMLQEAVRDGILKSNPVRGLGRLLASSTAKKQEPDPFSKAELGRLEQAASEHREVYRDLIAFMIRTGVRIGEALTVQFGDIDFAVKRIWIQRAISCNPALKGDSHTPKTPTSTRDIDLSPEAMTMLVRRKKTNAQWELQNPDFNPDDYIFESHTGGILDYGSFRRYFARVQKKAGLRIRSIHQLRHSYASIMLSDGAPLLYVSKQLGHANPDITLRIYSRWIPSESVTHSSIMDGKPSKDPVEKTAKKSNEKE